jgi:hypothetical protein
MNESAAIERLEEILSEALTLIAYLKNKEGGEPRTSDITGFPEDDEEQT